jgi:hypothetical protein
MAQVIEPALASHEALSSKPAKKGLFLGHSFFFFLNKMLVEFK